MQGYLYDTPHGWWTNPGRVDRRHSQRFPDAIRQAIAGAKSHIDILNMQEPNALYDPDDRGLPKPGGLCS